MSETRRTTIADIWKTVQKCVASQVIDHDDTDLRITRIGGLDISFVKDTDEAVVCFVILAFPSLEVLHEFYHVGKMKNPYVPGYLAFRELPLLNRVYLEALATLPGSWHPQLIFVDGNGILHPHGAGLASHFGVVHNIPTIGVAKSLHAGVSIEDVKEMTATLYAKGDRFELHNKEGKVIGAGMKPAANVKKPIFVSVGNKICLEMALFMTEQCCKYRIPEPIRQADLRGRAKVRSLP